jgi:hypothetical protein
MERRGGASPWGTKSIHEIKKRDVIDLVSEVSQRSPTAGYRLLKTLKTFFRWCVRCNSSGRLWHGMVPDLLRVVFRTARREELGRLRLCLH